MTIPKIISDDTFILKCDMVDHTNDEPCFDQPMGWLVGCFGFTGPLRRYFGHVGSSPGEREKKKEK